MQLTAPPRTLRLWHPACLVATWFGSGLLPYTPGTFGSAAALPFAWLIQVQFGAIGLLVAAAAAFAVGIWASGLYIRHSGVDDPGPVVIDEVAAQWLTLAVVPPEFLFYVVGFVLFRTVDILKPWPARWVDQRVAGPWGVMLDDIVAAGYAILVLVLLVRWTL